MPNDSISRKVFVMNDIENKKIVQHNDLITSVAKMDKMPLKFFELAVASLDIKNIPDDRTVHVSKELLFSFFDVKSENKHTRFKEAILKVHEQAIFSMQEMNKRKGKYEYKIISPLEQTSWNDYEDSVSFKFTESILPYLVELKENFTQYLLSDIAKLNSKYSIIIYKWLSMNFNQYEYYRHTNSRREIQLEKYRNPIITIKELRRLSNTENEYGKFFNFETRILKTAEKEINQCTTLNMSYEKIKKGRSIDSIQFHISKKEKPQELNGEYKTREQDPAYMQDKANREEQEDKLFKQAMQNPYTMELITSTLLSPVEMTDITLMANLQQEVYPLYKQLEAIVGLKGVRKHLEYVANKKLDYSKPNLVKYLKTAVMRYLESGDTKQPEKDKTRYVKTKGKVTPIGSKTPDWPDWYVPDYKNETTPEEKKELEKIKKELSESMKK